MPGVPSPCAKCNSAGAGEGDSWCVGCRAMESSQNLLRQRWFSDTYRRLGEETLIQTARQLKALKGLDSGLRSLSDSWEARIKKASSARASEPASSGRERDHPGAGRGAGPPREREPPRGYRDQSPAARPPASPSEESAEEESEEEDVVEEKGHESTAPKSKPTRPRTPSRSPVARRKRKRGPRPGHRGGAKHPRRFRELQDPNFRGHRAYNSADLKLSVRAHKSELDRELPPR